MLILLIFKLFIFCLYYCKVATSNLEMRFCTALNQYMFYKNPIEFKSTNTTFKSFFLNFVVGGKLIFYLGNFHEKYTFGIVTNSNLESSKKQFQQLGNWKALHWIGTRLQSKLKWKTFASLQISKKSFRFEAWRIIKF